MWLNKKKILVKSIELAYRHWDSSNFNDPTITNHILTPKLSSTEKNSILSGLYLTVTNKETIEKFTKLFTENISPGHIGDYIKSVREELDLKKLKIPSEQMAGFYNDEPTD